MLNLLRSASAGLLMMLNVLLAVLFIACCLAPRMHPQDWWFTGFLGLFFPYFFVLMILFFFGWLLVRRKWAVFPLVILVAGIVPFSVHYSFNFGDDFNVEKSKDIRVMNWNIRHFIPFDEQGFKPGAKEQDQLVYDEIEKYQPDVICFQEFISIPSLGNTDPAYVLANEFGYKYVQFSGQEIFGSSQKSGIAIFSRLPILGGDVIKFPSSIKGSSESTLYVDLKVDDDTVRLYSVHLQSFGFGNREYKAIDEIKNQSPYDVLESKNVLRKMRNTFYWHGLQSDFVKEKISKSPHPVMLTGDLNDVPNSYAYTVMRGSMKDSFLEKGAGLGATFTSATSSILRVLPTLRIDYIFVDPIFETSQFEKGGDMISDHQFLVADFNIK
jgi:endonuclease/exonuclease/phosphatase family metal-dependent hydrolase